MTAAVAFQFKCFAVAATTSRANKWQPNYAWTRKESDSEGAMVHWEKFNLILGHSITASFNNPVSLFRPQISYDIKQIRDNQILVPTYLLLCL